MTRDLLVQMENDVIRALVSALEIAHPFLVGHSERVASYAVAMGCELGLSKPTLRLLRIAAALHDVGMLGLSTELLARPNPTPDQWHAIREHPRLSVQLLRRIQRFQDALILVECHHERWDGGGYPNGWCGEQIPLPARVLAVAEAFDGMRTPMPYRPPLSEPDAIALIEQGAGTLFDPRVVKAFLRVQPIIQPLGRE
ncbi:Cyclic di-GMP phosphodiesterase response regulator RpfG [bacterium HR15]|nr:Cyclic di-GMP phosphodiesterase response regulator RpfG [bacterium HR15]